MSRSSASSFWSCAEIEAGAPDPPAPRSALRIGARKAASSSAAAIEIAHFTAGARRARPARRIAAIVSFSSASQSAADRRSRASTSSSASSRTAFFHSRSARLQLWHSER